LETTGFISACQAGSRNHFVYSVEKGRLKKQISSEEKIENKALRYDGISPQTAFSVFIN